MSKPKEINHENKQETCLRPKIKLNCTMYRALLFAGLFLIFSSLSYIGYSLYQFNKNMMNNQKNIEDLKTTTLTYQSDKDLQDKKLLIQEEQIKALKQHFGYKLEKWQLAEAQYLLKLANFNLQFQHNSEVALQLTNAAENLLAKISLAELQSIRNNLADITYQLKSINSEDLSTILMRLNTLQKHAIKLTLPLPKFAQRKSDKNESTTSHQNWHGQFQSALSELKDMVVIKYHEKPLNEEQIPPNRNYLREQLAMLMTQAEWAAMRNAQPLYQSSINTALKWVQDNFNTDDSEVQAFLQSLEQLQKTTVSTNQYPNLSSVIDAIQSILERQETSEGKANINSPKEM